MTQKWIHILKSYIDKDFLPLVIWRQIIWWTYRVQNCVQWATTTQMMYYKHRDTGPHTWNLETTHRSNGPAWALYSCRVSNKLRHHAHWMDEKRTDFVYLHWTKVRKLIKIMTINIGKEEWRVTHTLSSLWSRSLRPSLLFACRASRRSLRSERSFSGFCRSSDALLVVAISSRSGIL